MIQDLKPIMRRWRRGRLGRRALVAGFAVLSCVLALGPRGLIAAEPAKAPAPARNAEAAAKTVTLIIDFGDGFEKRYTALAWRHGLTALGALEAAKSHPRVPLAFESTGSDVMAFVKSIDGVANEGAQGAKRNWLFSVNGTFADKSAGVFILSAGDTVRWHFGPYDRRED